MPYGDDFHRDRLSASTLLQWYRPGMTYGGADYARSNMDWSWIGPAISASAGAVQQGVAGSQASKLAQQQAQQLAAQAELERLRLEQEKAGGSTTVKVVAVLAVTALVLGGGIIYLRAR